MADSSALSVGLTQISPIWLHREATIDKIVSWMGKASAEGCSLVVFGETLMPGYPFWVERTGGAEFNSIVQKSLFAHYVAESVAIEDGNIGSVHRKLMPTYEERLVWGDRRR